LTKTNGESKIIGCQNATQSNGESKCGFQNTAQPTKTKHSRLGQLSLEALVCVLIFLSVLLFYISATAKINEKVNSNSLKLTEKIALEQNSLLINLLFTNGRNTKVPFSAENLSGEGYALHYQIAKGESVAQQMLAGSSLNVYGGRIVETIDKQEI
jgi:hypothetical protein